MRAFPIKPLPDAPWKWPLIIALTLIFGAFSYAAARFFGPLGFVITTPLLAVAGAHWLVEGASAGYRWLGWMPYAGWQGRYYAFEGQQIRVIVANDALWFVDRDVLAVLQTKRGGVRRLYRAHEYARLPGTVWFGFSEEGLKRLLSKSTHPDAKRFAYWLERDVLLPHRNNVERNRVALHGAPIMVMPDVLPEPPGLKPANVKPADR